MSSPHTFAAADCFGASQLVEGGAARVDFKPTTLWRDESTDWWGACIE